MGGLRDELLTPFRGIREAGRSLAGGSSVICRCAARLLRRGASVAWARASAGETLADRVESLGAAALTAAVGGTAAVLVGRVMLRMVAPYGQVIGWSVLAVWVLGAWTVGPAPTARAKIVSGGGEAAGPVEAPKAVPLTVAEIAVAVRTVAAPNGWLGAHLDDVLAHLPGRSREELLTVLAEAGIPVENQLKLTLPGGRQRNRQGIRLTALPPGPAQPSVPAPPEAAVEAAPPGVPLIVYGPE